MIGRDAEAFEFDMDVLFPEAPPKKHAALVVDAETSGWVSCNCGESFHRS